MEDSESIENDSPLDQSAETEVEENPIATEENDSEDGTPVSKSSSQRTSSSSNYFNSLTWNFDTISGVLALAFVALGTCMMYFQNSIKFGSYLLGIAILIGLFHSFVCVYLPNFTLGKHSKKDSGNADSSENPSSPKPMDSSSSSESSDSE